MADVTPVQPDVQPVAQQPALDPSLAKLVNDDGSIVLKTPDGEFQDVAAHEVRTAIQKGGFSLPDPQEVSHFENEQKYGGTLNAAKAFGEGAANAVTFGGFTGLERMFGRKPEDILGVREAHPVAYGAGNIGGLGLINLVPGLGEAADAAKVAETVDAAKGVAALKAINPLNANSVMEGIGARAANAMGLSGYSGAAAQAAAATAVFQGGDEISKMLASDPEQSIGTAIANTGLAGLLGAPFGLAGEAIRPLWEAKFGSKALQGLSDFKGRIMEHINNPDPVGLMKEELGTFYDSMKQMGHEVYGATGLKSKDIAAALPKEVSEQMAAQVGDIGDRIGQTIRDMQKNPENYPPRLVNKLQQDLSLFNQEYGGSEGNPKSIFDAFNTLKQKFQDTVDSSGLYDKLSPLKSIAPEYDYVKKVDSFAKEIKNALEDSNVWGKAADSQKIINKSFSEYLPKLKDFESKFTEKLEGNRTISPGKISTYYNQLGKPNAELKQEMLTNFLDSSDKYRGVVDAAYKRLGLENPNSFPSTSFSRTTLNELTSGAKVADALVKKGLAKLGGTTLGGGIGAAAGASVGHPWLGGLIGEHALGPFFTSILPGIINPLLKRAESPYALKTAVDFGMNVIRGESIINRAASNLFKAGSEVIPAKLIPTQKDTEKLDKIIDKHFKNPDKLYNMPQTPGYLPDDHQKNISVLAGNAVNLIHSAKPNPVKARPLDSEPVVSNVQKAEYERTLTLAQQPMVILKDIQNGTVSAKDVVLIKQLHPALYSKLVSKIATNMADHLDNGGTIPYKMRMGLSVFMGEPMDSTMTPEAIQATQMASAASQAEAQEQKQPKGSPKELNKFAESYETPGQNREAYRASKN